MPHDDDTGLVLNPDDFQRFVKGIDSGDPRDFIDTPLGPIAGTPGSPVWRSSKAKKHKAKVRAWESQGAGNTFDLEGPDAQAVTMPPAPVLGSNELIAEMGEVYVQALLRDVPFTDITDESGKVSCKPSYGSGRPLTVKTALKELARLAIERKTGARGLRSIIEDIMLDIMFNLPDYKNKTITITKEVVLKQKEPKVA